MISVKSAISLFSPGTAESEFISLKFKALNEKYSNSSEVSVNIKMFKSSKKA